MTLDPDEKSSSDDPPFATVLQRFLASMEAVVELAEFATEHAPTIDDQSVAIERIVSRRMPNATPAQHSMAVGIVTETLSRLLDPRHESVDEEVENDSEDLSNDDVLARVLEKLREDIQEVTEDPIAFVDYVSAYLETIRRPKRYPVLMSSLLATAVANFEVLISGTVREFLALKPEIMRGDGSKYTLAEIEGFQSLEEFREYCSERHAENLLRGGFDDWLGWFDQRLKIKLSDLTDRPVSVTEIFQRRHLFMHNGGVVNRLYLKKLPGLKPAPPLDFQLQVDFKYLTAAIESLVSVGSILVVFVMRRLIPIEDEHHPADSIMSAKIFQYLQEGQWPLVVSLAGRMIEGCASENTKLIMRVNCWVAQKRLNGVASIEGEVRPWQVSVLSREYQLAKYALLDDLETGYALAQEMLDREELSARAWNTWPLLAELREFGSVRDAAVEGSESAST